MAEAVYKTSNFGHQPNRADINIKGGAGRIENIYVRRERESAGTNHALGKSVLPVEISRMVETGRWRGVWVLATGRRRDAPIKYTKDGGGG